MSKLSTAFGFFGRGSASLPGVARISKAGISCIPAVLACFCFLNLPAGADTSTVNGDPYVDDLHSLAFESQSPYWQDVKAQLSSGNIDYAIKKCRQVKVRRSLDVDMHCMYALALEMKLRGTQYDDSVFDECVREWAHVAKYKVVSHSTGWDHVGEGEAFVANQDRKKMANRHLVSLVGRAPKYFESEEAYLSKIMTTSTQVAGKVKLPPKKDM